MKQTLQQREKYLQDSFLCSELKILPSQVDGHVCVPLRVDVLRGLLADFILRREHGEVDAKTVFAVLVSSCHGKALETIESYAEKYDRNLRWVILDEQGNGWGSLSPDEKKRIEVPPLSSGQTSSYDPSGANVADRTSLGSLFTPNNQWLLKVMLLSGIDNLYWGGPHLGRPFGVGELSDGAGVPQPSVSRFVALAEEQGFILRSGRGLGMRRIPDLLDQWVYHLKNSPDHIMHVRPMYESSPLDEWDKFTGDDLVAGGESAIRALGLSIRNHGRVVLYTESFNQAVEKYGLVECPKEQSVCDLRIPNAARAVFDAAVERKEGKIADIIQLYLDARLSVVRGEEQAEHIFESVLAPFFRKKKWH